MIELTVDERHKFSAYCEQEARSYGGLVEQAKTLPGGEMMAAPIARKAVAYALVARELRNVEELTIGATSTTTGKG